ncbi:hypothetical protein ACWDU8_33015, partial [Streptomyces sp. NPDC003388]
ADDRPPQQHPVAAVASRSRPRCTLPRPRRHTGPGDSPGSGALTVLAVIRGVLTLAAAPDLAAVTRRLRREPGERSRRPTRGSGGRPHRLSG